VYQYTYSVVGIHKIYKLKTIKIIFGFLLLFGAGQAYAQASRDLGTFFSPGVIVGVLLMLFLSTWLIGSGFSVRKMKLKSFDSIKFFIISFITFTIIAIFNLGNRSKPSHIIDINGIKIPLGKCIDGNRKIIPNENERKEYCECFAEKILNNPKLKDEYQKDLENNKIDIVFNKIQSNPLFLELGIEECLNSIEIKWSDNIQKSMIETWKKELKGSEFELTNNIDEYCNCMMSEYKNFPLTMIIEEGFSESTVAIEIDEKCTIKTIK
jgi:hypothetical protein